MLIPLSLPKGHKTDDQTPGKGFTHFQRIEGLSKEGELIEILNYELECEINFLSLSRDEQNLQHPDRTLTSGRE